MPFARGIGPLELIIILVIVMMIFGVGKLPQVGQAMGKAIREFRKSQNDDSQSDEAEEKPKPAQAEAAEEAKDTTQKSITH